MYIIDFFKNLFKRSNVGILIYLLANALFVFVCFGGFIGLFIYLIGLCLALSPIGEWFLRIITGCKAIERTEYKERLERLFNEVYINAKKQAPNLQEGIKTVCLS